MTLWRHVLGARSGQRILTIGMPPEGVAVLASAGLRPEALQPGTTVAAKSYDHALGVIGGEPPWPALEPLVRGVRTGGRVALVVPPKRGRAGIPRGLGRRLVEADVPVTHTRWLGGSWTDPSWTAPMESKAVTRWVARDWFVPWTSREVLLSSASWVGPRQALSYLAGGAVVVGRRGCARAWAPLTDLVADLRQQPDLQSLLQGPVEAVLLRGGPGSRRLVAFVFDEHSCGPVLFFKMAGDPDRARLRREHANLQAVARYEALRGSLPSPVALVEEEQVTLAAQTALAGTSLATRLRRRLSAAGARGDVEQTLAWLSQLQAFTVEGATTSVDAASFAARLLHQLPGPEWAGLRQRLSAAAREASSRTVPLVRRHGDFWAGNVLYDGDTIGVVDWEHSRAASRPWQDLFMLLSTYPEMVSRIAFMGRSRRPGFDVAWLERSRVGVDCRRLARQFLMHHGVAPVHLDVLLVDFLLDMIDDPPFGDRLPWQQDLRRLASAGGVA